MQYPEHLPGNQLQEATASPLVRRDELSRNAEVKPGRPRAKPFYRARVLGSPGWDGVHYLSRRWHGPFG